jgi:hypothetical protein
VPALLTVCRARSLTNISCTTFQFHFLPVCQLHVARKERKVKKRCVAQRLLEEVVVSSASCLFHRLCQCFCLF